MTTPVIGQYSLTKPGIYGGVNVTITPYSPASLIGNLVPGFMSGPLVSQPIIVTFSAPVNYVAITAVVNAPGNLMIAYDKNGNELGRSEFSFNTGILATSTTSTRAFSISNIASIKLQPPQFGFTYYPELDFVPQNATITPSNPSFDPATLVIPIELNIIQIPHAATLQLPLQLIINPPIPVFAPKVIAAYTTLKINPLPIPLHDVFLSAIRQITSQSIATFFDETRVLKTLLNFGNDRQELLTNWQYDLSDATRQGILAKTYRPLPDDITEKELLWISREIAPPIIDQVVAFQDSARPEILYLRPANKDLTLAGYYGTSVENTTLAQLFPSGSPQISSSIVALQDSTLEKYYTFDDQDTILNIDYSDYSNFVKYGSATSRILAFKNKLLTLEGYNSLLATQSLALSASLAFSSLGNISSSAVYTTLITTTQNRQNLLRSFDAYEKFLYYGTGSAYSSSFNKQEDDLFFYHSQANYPKVSSSVGSAPQLISVISASNGVLYSADTFFPSASLTDQSWFGKQLYIAAQYDLHNQTSLANNLPAFILEDKQSSDYLTFLNLIGQHFDNIKLYADHMTDIFNRDNNPNVGLSKNLIWNVAQSLGIDLPNQYAIQGIANYLVGSGSLSPRVYQTIAAETWKRFLHNQIFLSKAKGTKSAINALMNVYGIRPEIIRLRESIYPSPVYPSASYETFTQVANVLQMGTASFIQLPWSSSGLSYNTFEARFSTTQNTESVLINGGSSWALILFPTGSASLGQVQLLDKNKNIAIASSTSSFFNGDYYSVMLRYNVSGMDMTIKKYNKDRLVYAFTGSENIALTSASSQWFTPQTAYLGGSGSFVAGTSSFAGLYDEVHISGERLTDTVFDDHARYPALYYGNTSGSAITSLYIRLAFNYPINLGVATTTLLPNESPFVSSSNVPTSLKSFSASFFPNSSSFPYNMVKTYANVLRYSPNAGGVQYNNNTVIVAPPATPFTMITNSGQQIPYLSRTTSTVTLPNKKNYPRVNNRLGFYFTLSDTINDSMFRSLGRLDLNTLIGDPTNLYQDGYSTLSSLNSYYWQTYAYQYNLNTYIGLVKNLLGSLFSTVGNYVPVRAKLLTGFVIEPHLLNRSKIKSRPSSIQGQNARQNLASVSQSFTASTWNLDARPADIVATASALVDNNFFPDIPFITASLHAFNLYKTASIALATASLKPTNNTYFANPTIATASLKPSNQLFKAYITGSNTASVIPSLNSVDDFTEIKKYAQYLLTTFGITNLAQLPATSASAYYTALNAFKPGTRIPVSSIYATSSVYMPSSSYLLPAIPPLGDFRPENPGAFEYFIDAVSGNYGELTFTQAFYNAPVLNNRGIWAYGTTYKINDYVQQPVISGSAAPGNNNLFVCLTSKVVGATSGTLYPFVSNIAPYLDPTNWMPMKYVRSVAPRLREVVAGTASGSVQLVPFASANKPFTGYAAYHFKFIRENRIAYRAARWVGCTQTQDTTIDGKSPVEVFQSAQSQLVVNANTLPVVKTNDQSGPILNVE